MKRILSIIFAGCLLFTATSCDDFLTETPTTAITDSDAFLVAADYENALNGVYYTLGTYRLYGRNLQALADIASDMANHSAATTHFYNVFAYNITPTNIYSEAIWAYGYYAMDRAARIIQAGLEASGMLDNDMATVHKTMAQAYAIKALVNFHLTNVFALPYSDANKASLGIVNMGDAPFPPYSTVSRATVEENYQQMLSDIAKAKEYYGKPGVTNAGYVAMNQAAIYALEARVRLYMKDYTGAISAANTAIELRDGNIVSDLNAYQNMFRELTISSEDIFVIAKSETDYLSANSANTLWTNYGVSLNSSAIAEFAADDIRAEWFTPWSGGKMGGIWTNDQISNLPVFRLPEMYLTLAEAYAQTGDYANAKTNLLAVAAKRNASYDADAVAADASILPVILQERKLELAQEGHRFFDARRLNETISVTNGTYTNFEIAKFVFPIPASEINTGYGVDQTPDWGNNLPR